MYFATVGCSSFNCPQVVCDPLSSSHLPFIKFLTPVKKDDPFLKGGFPKSREHIESQFALQCT